MNKFFKAIVIVMMMLVATMSLGCESQAEKQAKFEKLEQDYKILELQIVNNINIADKEKTMDKEFAIYEKGVKDLEKIVNEMENVAKGNKELEKKAIMKRKTIENEKKGLIEAKQLAKQHGFVK